jgi:hypothetical protein
MAPTEDCPRWRIDETEMTAACDMARSLKPLHQHRRRPGKVVSVAQLPVVFVTPRVDPAIPAESEAVRRPRRDAAHLNTCHGGDRSRVRIHAEVPVSS